MLILLSYIGFTAPKIIWFSNLDFECTDNDYSSKRVVYTKLNTYVFILLCFHQ